MLLLLLQFFQVPVLGTIFKSLDFHLQFLRRNQGLQADMNLSGLRSVELADHWSKVSSLKQQPSHSPFALRMAHLLLLW